MGIKIGIVGTVKTLPDDNTMFGVHEDYMNFVEQFGSPVIIPRVSRKDFFRNFKVEALVLPGGADVDPYRYSSNRLSAEARKMWYCYPADPYMEHFDTEILPGLFHAGFPVFGICRGLQTLNVHFGGTLRNVDWHPQSINKKHKIHRVTVSSGEVQGIEMGVNSFHHQAIGRLATGFRVSAFTEDGIIEGIKHETLPISAVQWHPERLHDDWSVQVCRNLFS